MTIPLKYPKRELPQNFNQHVEELTKLAAQIEGYLTRKKLEKRKLGIYTIYESD